MYERNINPIYVHITPLENLSSIIKSGFVYSPTVLENMGINYTTPYDYFQSSKNKTTKTSNNQNSFVFFGLIGESKNQETFESWFQEESIFSSVGLYYINEPYYFGKSPYRNDRERFENAVDINELSQLKIFRELPGEKHTDKILVIQNGKGTIYDWV